MKAFKKVHACYLKSRHCVTMQCVKATCFLFTQILYCQTPEGFCFFLHSHLTEFVPL